jgi:catechol 2,3-dioxygenase-like lactoylglutathione lyase family enzyme
MEQRLSLVTIGVANLADSIRFYEALGWTRAMKEAEGVAFFQLGAIGLSLYPIEDACAEAGVHWRGHGGFGGIALAHNVRARAEVDQVVAAWTAAGGTVTHVARDMPWGGYCAHVADPDGNIWEIAWNPGFPIDKDGGISIPE